MIKSQIIPIKISGEIKPPSITEGLLRGGELIIGKEAQLANRGAMVCLIVYC